MVYVVSVEENTRDNIFFALLLYYKQYMFCCRDEIPRALRLGYVILLW